MVDRLERDTAMKEFRLHLGKILSVKNWNRKLERPIDDKES
jgi:hypothetical protein